MTRLPPPPPTVTQSIGTLNAISNMNSAQVKAMEERIELARIQSAAKTHARYYVSQLVMFSFTPAAIAFSTVLYNMLWTNPPTRNIEPEIINSVLTGTCMTLLVATMVALVIGAITANAVSLIHEKHDVY